MTYNAGLRADPVPLQFFLPQAIHRGIASHDKYLQAIRDLALLQDLPHPGACQ